MRHRTRTSSCLHQPHKGFRKLYRRHSKTAVIKKFLLLQNSPETITDIIAKLSYQKQSLGNLCRNLLSLFNKNAIQLKPLFFDLLEHYLLSLDKGDYNAKTAKELSIILFYLAKAPSSDSAIIKSRAELVLDCCKKLALCKRNCNAFDISLSLWAHSRLLITRRLSAKAGRDILNVLWQQVTTLKPFTLKGKRQLLQADTIMRSFYGRTHLSPKLRRAIEKQAQQQRPPSSKLHLDIAQCFAASKIFNEYFTLGYYIDIAVPSLRLAIEVDGPSHFGADGDLQLDSIVKQRLLKAHGWKVLHIPYYDWDKLSTPKSKHHYLNAVLNAVIGNQNTKAILRSPAKTLAPSSLSFFSSSCRKGYQQELSTRQKKSSYLDVAVKACGRISY